MSFSTLLRSSMVRAVLRTVGVALVASVVFAPAAQAQAPVLGNFTYVTSGSNGSIGGTPVGPYRANLSGFTAAFTDRTNAPIWCVDYTHVAPSATDTYYATKLSGTDFTKTRFTQATYQKAAWLIEQYDAGVANFTAVNVQGTIWKLMNGASAPTTGYTDLTSFIPATTISLSKSWFVLTDDASKCGATCTDLTDNQEYLYTSTVTPEPSTYLLMAAGLGVVGVMARRRRRGAMTAV